MKLGDLARSSQTPTSFLSGFWILLSRFKSKNTSSDSRGSYESVFISTSVPRHLTFCSKRPWSLFIVFFTVLAVLAPSLPFLFGRIMRIETFTRVRPTALPLPCVFLTFGQNQRMKYREVLITGDLSPDDISRATERIAGFNVSQPYLDQRMPVLTTPRTTPEGGHCFHTAGNPRTHPQNLL